MPLWRRQIGPVESFVAGCVIATIATYLVLLNYQPQKYATGNIQTTDQSPLKEQQQPQPVAITCQSSLLSLEAKPQSLKKIWDDHAGYFSEKWSNYLVAYEEEFSRIRARKRSVVMLELGVGNGGSLQIWKKFFGAEAEIYGVDKNPLVCSKLRYEPGITVHCLDYNDTSAVEKLFTVCSTRFESVLDSVLHSHYGALHIKPYNAIETLRFDVIVDDAGHTSPYMKKAFETFWPMLRPGGVYAVEDVSFTYYKHNDGLRGKNGFMEYAKELADVTHMWNILSFQKGLPSVFTDWQREVGFWLETISFRENMVILRKLEASKTMPFDVITTGRNISVFPNYPASWKAQRELLVKQRAISIDTRVD